MVSNWCRDKWGRDIGDKIWLNSLPNDLEALYNKENEEAWNKYCTDVYYSLRHTDLKSAKEEYKSAVCRVLDAGISAEMD